MISFKNDLNGPTLLRCQSSFKFITLLKFVLQASSSSHDPHTAAAMAAYHDLYEEFEDDRDAHRLTPARVRSALNKVLQETDMKIGEFQRMLGVNANTWGKFMTNNYKDKTWGAAASGTYSAGLYFCYREKRLGSASVLKTRARVFKTLALPRRFSR